MLGQLQTPDTLELFDAITNQWYPVLVTVFSSVASVLVVFWTYRSVRNLLKGHGASDGFPVWNDHDYARSWQEDYEGSELQRRDRADRE